MGISDPVMEGPVIDANGLSANEVVERVKNISTKIISAVSTSF